MTMSIHWIREKVKDNEYEFSSHAADERQADKISVIEVEKALLESEILEAYSDDPGWSSCLVLGYGEEGFPIHTVCGKTISDRMRIIAIYIPSLPKWIDPKTKRISK